MAKNIVVCCDGTANEFAKKNTNVVKLYSILTQDPPTQVSYYHPGLGTREPAGALTSFARKVTKAMGLAFGYGLADDMRDAYVFLMRTYRPGDRVFLFGFSRGAYTVRAVASLLHMYGLLRPDNEALVPYAIRMLMGIKRAEGRDEKARKDYFELADAFKAGMSLRDGECKPHFVGVWDTVSSVGWVENPLKLPFVSDNPSIHIGRHAIAIDERRAFFRTNLWRWSASQKTHGPLDELQVWFPGVHCDVGGGYEETGLSDVALRWMVEEAEKAGLLCDRTRRDELLKPNAPPPSTPPAIHESLKGFWHVAELVWKKHYDWAKGRWGRRMNLWRRRTWPKAPLVHVSAYQRGEAYCSRIPKDAICVGGNPAEEKRPA